MKLIALLVDKEQHCRSLPINLIRLSQPANFEAQGRLRSTSSPSLTVRRTWLSTIGERALPSTQLVLETVSTITVCLPQSPQDTQLVLETVYRVRQFSTITVCLPQSPQDTPLYGAAFLDCTRHS